MGFADFLRARLYEMVADATTRGDSVTMRWATAALEIMTEHRPDRRDATRCRVCTAIAHERAARFRAPCPTVRFLLALFEDHPDYQHALWAPPESALATPEEN